METNTGYQKEYKMRRVISGKKHITVAMPYEVVEREARIRGLTVEQFIERFIAVASYDNFEGIRYTFQEVENGTI